MPTTDTMSAPGADSTSAPGPTMDEQYPIRDVRFVKGRTYHRTKRPEAERWWDLLEAACGKTGYLERGWCRGPVTPCKGCHKAIYGALQAAS